MSSLSIEKLSLSVSYEDLMALWERGFVGINVTEPDPAVTLTKMVGDKEELIKLDEKYRDTLLAVIFAIKTQG